jgi:hypothetical protein
VPEAVVAVDTPEQVYQLVERAAVVKEPLVMEEFQPQALQTLVVAVEALVLKQQPRVVQALLSLATVLDKVK